MELLPQINGNQVSACKLPAAVLHTARLSGLRCFQIINVELHNIQWREQPALHSCYLAGAQPC